jgi:geranylgeranyl diphosphate synthase type I
VNSQISGLYLGESTLQAASADALLSGGKRVRAVLALLWCETISGDHTPALPLAVAYELAHASALIQDDIIDSSGQRRGKSSIVSKYGLQTAILAANLLLFNVPKKMAEYSYMESRTLARLFDMLGESCRAATMGEFLDLELARSPESSEEDYERMVKLKTASMLGAPCAGGALVGRGTEAEVSLAYAFGEQLGIAYQMQDDVLDLMGNEATLGKPVFTDMRGGKKNIVVIHALKRSTAEERDRITGLFGKPSYAPEEIRGAREIFRKYGSVEYSAGRVSDHLSEAKRMLSALRGENNKNNNKASTALLELSDYLSKRYY